MFLCLSDLVCIFSLQEASSRNQNSQEKLKQNGGTVLKEDENQADLSKDFKSKYIFNIYLFI